MKQNERGDPEDCESELRHGTEIIPGLNNDGEAILVDWTDRANVWKWPVHVYGVRRTVPGGGRTRAQLDCGMDVSLVAREEEWALKGSGLGSFVDAQ